MTSRERIRAVVDRHVATVGTADADALAALYAPDGSVRGGLANATAVASVRYQAHPPNGPFWVFLGRCLRVANFLERCS